ncbi:MAG: DUF2339 domain-containing protein [Sedimentisphaerales bacterium]|nr:DUF2339 domain-containing protein [Sedimentisphaerales bacterium]
MAGFACIWVFLAILFCVAVPAAFIMSIIALNKISAIEQRLRQMQPKEIPMPLPPMVHKTPPPPTIIEPIVAVEEQKSPLAEWQPPKVDDKTIDLPLVGCCHPVDPGIVPPSVSDKAAEFAERMKNQVAAQRLSFELFIGTRGLAIAGCIAVLVGVIVGFKYLYEMKLITPQWQMIIVAGGGIVALAIGQFTRRRGYDIVATALSSLGFAMLYAADFAAFGFYHLIGTNLAFGLAVVITAAGMLYAVRLNEIIVAFISLLGGFLSPVLLSSGENRPNMLFGYMAILIGGAMACAAVRKWRSVSRLSFVGMAMLYIGWFHEWYRPAMYGESIPDQLPVAITWLCVFAAIYLIMPVLYELLKREVAHKGDVLLIVTNGFFCYVYLHQILFSHYRPYLALAAVCLGAAHLAVMAVVHKRCPHDTALKLSLLVLGLFFITIAIPLYLKMYAVALAWAGEGVVLALIATRYHSKLVGAASFAAFVLSIIMLAQQLPLHKNTFTFIINSQFGSWCFVVAVIYAAHLMYRCTKNVVIFSSDESDYFPQIMFCMSMIVLLAAVMMEWYGHTEYNLTATLSNLHEKWFAKGAVVICSAFVVLFLLPVFRPAGVLPVVASTALAAGISIATLAMFPDFYEGKFTIFANAPFVIGLVPLVALAIAASLLYRNNEFPQAMKQVARGYGLAIVFFLWLFLTEEIYLYWNYPGRVSFKAGIDLGQMWISILWAVYAAVVISVGLWRKIITLRYIGLCFFTIVLIKVFVFDMGTLEKIYRIAGFIVLGLVLIGVSYLYQYLRKTGFFEKTPSIPNGT